MTTNAVVVANGYERHGDAPLAARRRDVPVRRARSATPPNADAARWFVREVFPAVRAHRPDARVRIVGGGEHHVSDLASIEGVERARPGRRHRRRARRRRRSRSCRSASGSGTRLKVVEALANRLPLVATTLGVEGIDVVDGRHALLADDAESFAARLPPPARRTGAPAAIADEGEALWDERYRWSTIRHDLADLARFGSAQAPETESRTTAGEWRKNCSTSRS